MTVHWFVLVVGALVFVRNQVTGNDIVCPSKPVEALLRQEVTLACYLDPPLDATDKTVKWSRGNDVVYHRQSGKYDSAEWMEEFRGRTSLPAERLRKGDLSLTLSSPTFGDCGRYECSFESEWLKKSCYVDLSFGEFEVIGSESPVRVLEYQTAVLPGHVEPPFSTETITVEWKFNTSVVNLYRSRKNNLDSLNERFKDRTSLFDDENKKKGNISLKLTNVTKQDAGTYTCIVRIPNCVVKTSSVILEIVLEGDHDVDLKHLKTGEIAGIAVGLLVVIILILMTVVAVLVKRNGRRRERQRDDELRGPGPEHHELMAVPQEQ